MSYETMIGFRYLLGGKQRDRVMLLFSAGGVAVTLLGLALLLFGDPTSPVGASVFLGGIVATIVFALLAVFSVFVSVSVLGVALGVAALTIVLSVTTGFQRQFRDKILGVNAHVMIVKVNQTFAEYHDVMRAAMAIDRDVVAAQPFIFAEMLVTRGNGQISGVAVKGVDPKLVRSVLDLDKHIVSGSIDALDEPPCTDPCVEPRPIIIGKELALKLHAKIGDRVTIVIPLSSTDPLTLRATLSAPHTKVFRIAGVFYSGFDEYDRRLMYASLADIQALVGRGDQVMGVELKLANIDRAADIAPRLETALGGPPYQVQDWYEQNENLFQALNLQKLALVIILTLIIIVAAVNMVSALTMMVTDKTREIAILKSMGGTAGSISHVFVVIGLAIGGAGTIAGVGLGLIVCYVMSHYGYHLDPKVYLIDRLPIEVAPLEVVLVAGITMVVSMLATIIPAVTASAMRPVDGLRYD